MRLTLLSVIYHALTYQLPRPLTGSEMPLYDLVLFLWFVGTPAAAYAIAARRLPSSRSTFTAIACGPLLQLTWVDFVVLLVEICLYA